MRTLITGATGFVGGHLIELLLQGGEHDLHGLGREAAWPEALSHLRAVKLYSADLADLDQVRAALSAIRPQQIYHLAGYANTGGSFREPRMAWSGNLNSTLNLYQAMGELGLPVRTLFISSGLVYGNASPADRKLVETDPLNPASPYAASKAAADLLSYQVTCHPGLDVVRVRCFNQIGPRQSADFAIANFARQIAAIERGLQPGRMDTGDLSAERDLTDVRDMAQAYTLLMAKGVKGEVYNAGSGIVHSMQTVLDRLLAMAQTPIEVRQRIDAARRADNSATRADIGKLQQLTGWRPAMTLERTLADVLDFWRSLPNEKLVTSRA